MTRSLQGEMEDLPGLVKQSQDTLVQAEKLIEGIQKHWLIRGYIEQGEARYPEVRPGDVLGGGPVN